MVVRKQGETRWTAATHLPLCSPAEREKAKHLLYQGEQPAGDGLEVVAEEPVFRCGIWRQRH